MRWYNRWLPGLLLGVLAPALFTIAPAEQSVVKDDYTVHYTALTTDTLSQSVARAYGIRRSNNRGMVNVAVLKKAMGTTAQPVAAEVSGTATNLNAQLRQLEFREVSEGGARYYIAEFPVKDDELLEFSLVVQPAGGDAVIPLEFEQHFYTE